MLRSRKYLYLANVLLVIAIFPKHAAAQEKDKNIWDEYRPSVIIAMPVNEKLIVFQYNVLVYAPEKKLTTIGVTMPGITYRPFAPRRAKGTWLELWAGTLFPHGPTTTTLRTALTSSRCGRQDVRAKDKEAEHHELWAVRVQEILRKDNTSTEQPRFRDRVSIEIPLAKGDKRWHLEPTIRPPM